MKTSILEEARGFGPSQLFNIYPSHNTSFICFPGSRAFHEEHKPLDLRISVAFFIKNSISTLIPKLFFNFCKHNL